MDGKSLKSDGYMDSLPLLRLGEKIHHNYIMLFPDPFERTIKQKRIVGIKEKIKKGISEVRKLIAIDPAHFPIRRVLHVNQGVEPSENQVLALAVSSFCDIFKSHSEETADSIAHKIAPLIGNDMLIGKMEGRITVAALLCNGAFVLKGRKIEPCHSIRLFLVRDPLCLPGLTAEQLRSFIRKKSYNFQDCLSNCFPFVTSSDGVFLRLQKPQVEKFMVRLNGWS